MFRRLVSIVVSAALILVAPGMQPWAVAGQAASSGRVWAPAPIPSIGTSLLPGGLNAGVPGSVSLPAINLSFPNMPSNGAAPLAPSAAIPSAVVPSAVAPNAVAPRAVVPQSAAERAIAPTVSGITEALTQRDVAPALDKAYDRSRANMGIVTGDGDSVSGSQSASNPRITPRLAATLAGLSKGRRVRVVIEINIPGAAGNEKGARNARIARGMQEFSDRSAEVREYLDGEGVAYEQAWINGTISAELTDEQVARVAEIYRVRLIDAPNELQAEAAGSDVPAPASAMVRPAPADDDGGNAPKKGPWKPSVGVVLVMAAAAGAGAFFALPLALGWAAPLLPVWAAANILYVKIGVVAFGALAGVSASQWPTWAGFPRATWDAAREAGTTAFRFWARFGRVFHSVLTGGSTDEAMKAELPGSVLKYPVGAMPFVLAGYVSAPVLFGLGVLYKVIATPIAGAWRGVKQLATEFFPWLVDFLANIVTHLKNAVLFVAGGIWGALLGLVVPGVVAAVVTAKPLAQRVLIQSYKPETGAGWIGVAVIRVAAVVGIVAAAVAGFALGALSAIVYVPTLALHKALEFGGADNRVSRALARWFRSVEGNDNGIDYLGEYDLGDKGRDISVGEGFARLANVGAASIHLGASALALAFVAYARAWRDVVVRDVDPKIAPAVLDLPAPAPGLGGYASAVAASAKGTGRFTWMFWRSAGLRTDAALRGAEPRESLKDAYLAWPAAAAGALAYVPAVLLGGLYQGLVVPAQAAWRLAKRVALRIWPSLRRFFSFVFRAAKKFFPFVFGFVFGAVWGALEGAAMSAYFGVRPFGRLYDSDVRLRGWARWRYNAALVILAIPAALVAVANFALGLVLALPYAATAGFGLATRWSEASPRLARVFEHWKSYSLERRVDRALELHKDLPPGEAGQTGFKAFAAGLSAFVHGAFSFATFAPAGGRAVVDGYRDAAKYIDSNESAQLPERAREDGEWTAPEEKPWAYPSYAIALTGAILGAAAAAWFVFPAALALLGMWLGWAVVAGAALAGGSVGAGLAQKSLWTRLIPDTLGTARDGATVTYAYWRRAGAAFAAALKGTDRASQAGSKLAWLHTAAGGVMTIPVAILGAVVGAGSLAARAWGHGVYQVVREFLPALERLVRLIGRILWRIIPFGFGLAAGFVMGVVGSMIFGVLLLARPYFKHVVGESFEYRGLGGFLHNLSLKLVALVGGVIMGVLGLAVGLVVALPYAVTLIPSTAWQLADIGGGSQKFFDLWSKGTLRAELRRVMSLTGKFEFPDGGRRPLIDGWLRLANIVPATLAATLAGAVAGWVSYFRSIINAAKALKRGDAVPSDGFDSLYGVSRATGRGAKAGQWIGGLAGFAGAAFFGAAALIGMSGFLGFMAFWTGAWLLGLIAGAILGAAFGLLGWLADQLDK